MALSVQTLRCFLAVVEEGSISKAAERLHMSQPPLSVRIRALERELDVDLLVRHGRGVSPTVAGKVLVDHARRILLDIDTTGHLVRSVGRGTQGQIGVAVAATVGPRLLARLLGQLRAEAPDVEIMEADVTGDAVYDRVLHGDVDAGLLHLGPYQREQDGPGGNAPFHRNLEMAVVAREPLVAVLPESPEHSLSERADLSRLTDGHLILPARTSMPGLYEHSLNAWTAAGGDQSRIREVRTTTTLFVLVESGYGVAIVPSSLASVAWSGLAAVPLRQHHPPVETAVIWQDANPSPVLKRFLRLALATPEPDVLGPTRARTSSVAPSALLGLTLDDL